MCPSSHAMCFTLSPMSSMSSLHVGSSKVICHVELVVCIRLLVCPHRSPPCRFRTNGPLAAQPAAFAMPQPSDLPPARPPGLHLPPPPPARPPGVHLPPPPPTGSDSLPPPTFLGPLRRAAGDSAAATCSTRWLRYRSVGMEQQPPGMAPPTTMMVRSGERPHVIGIYVVLLLYVHVQACVSVQRQPTCRPRHSGEELAPQAAHKSAHDTSLQGASLASAQDNTIYNKIFGNECGKQHRHTHTHIDESKFRSRGDKDDGPYYSRIRRLVS